MLDGIEWAALLAIVVLVAGGKKLPELGSGLGKGISEFRKGMGLNAKPEEEPKQIGADAPGAAGTRAVSGE